MGYLILKSKAFSFRKSLNVLQGFYRVFLIVINPVAIPLPDDIKSYVDACIKVCDQRIAANQPIVSDDVSIAIDKVERVAAYTAIKSKLLETYAL